MTVSYDRSASYRERVDMLMFNGTLGLLLVVLAARLFLPPRLNFLKPVVAALGIGFIVWGGATGAFFYAEPGFKYHVRTFFGDEKMVRDVGWNTHLWGRVNALGFLRARVWVNVFCWA